MGQRALSESSARDSGKEKYICKGGLKKVCGTDIADDQDAIRCDVCEMWFHPKCQGITIRAFQVIAEYKLFWPCDTCREKLESTKNIIKYLDEKLETLGREIQVERKSIDEKLVAKLEEGLNQIEVALDRKLAEQKKAVETSLKMQEEVIENSVKAQAEGKQSYADMVAKSVKDIPKFTEELKNSAVNLTKMVESRKEKELRENNLILHNVKESREEDSKKRREHDEAVFAEVISGVLGDQNRPEIQIEKAYRLGKKTDDEKAKPRLLLIRLKSKENVDLIMKYRKLLRQNAPSLGPVFITRDLTKEEREKEWQLRKELEEKGKETHRVFRGKVIRK